MTYTNPFGGFPIVGPYILKPDAAEDFYVGLTHGDSLPRCFGTAADFVSMGGYGFPDSRWDRIDQTGTSAYDGTYGFQSHGLLIGTMPKPIPVELGNVYLPRKNLKNFATEFVNSYIHDFDNLKSVIEKYTEPILAIDR